MSSTNILKKMFLFLFSVSLASSAFAESDVKENGGGVIFNADCVEVVFYGIYPLVVVVISDDQFSRAIDSENESGLNIGLVKGTHYKFTFRVNRDRFLYGHTEHARLPLLVVPRSKRSCS